jgi:hypothetical protein
MAVAISSNAARSRESAFEAAASDIGVVAAMTRFYSMPFAFDVELLACGEYVIDDAGIGDGWAPAVEPEVARGYRRGTRTRMLAICLPFVNSSVRFVSSVRVTLTFCAP